MSLFNMSRIGFCLGSALLAWSGFAADRPIFSIRTMESVARSVKGLAGENGASRKLMLDETQRRLHDAYPELIPGPEEEGVWVFNSVGGSLAEIKILFCSTDEYIALWGAPLATEGFSGRYKKMDVWDIMIDGRMFSYAPGGEHQVDLYVNAGPDGTHQTSWLKRNIGKHFKLDAGTYMIDYGRGNLLASLKSGAIMGHKYVTGDKVSKNHMLSKCAKETFKNWLNKERREAIRKYRETNPDFL